MANVKESGVFGGVNWNEVYDAYPNGIGEIPGEVPGQHCIAANGLTGNTDLRELVESGRNKALTEFVRERLKERFFVGLLSGVGEVIAFVSRHKALIYPGESGVVFEAKKPKTEKIKSSRRNRKKGK